MKKILFLIFSCVLLFGISVSPIQAYYYGTAWDESISNPGNSNHGEPTDSAYLDAEYDAGLRLRNVYIRWNLYETANGTFDTNYIDQKKEEIKRLREKGFSIILRINPFPVPDWYWTQYPDAHFVNQYGSEWDPENPALPGFDPTVGAVSIWHPSYKTEFGQYMNHVFSQLGNNFWAVYLTPGKWGEVAYPEASDYYGHTNCYWAWDTHARAAIASNPVAASFTPGPQDLSTVVGERVVNGGFEDTTYSNTIANWESTLDTFYTGGWLPSVQTGAAPEGSRYLQYSSPPDTGGSKYHLRQAVVLKPNTSYTLNGSVRVTSADTTAHIEVSQPSGAFTWAPIANAFTSSSTWTSVSSGSFTSVTYTSKAYIDIYLTGSTALGTAEFDQISITDGLTYDSGAAQAFVEWYYQSMSDFINWQISEIKTHYDGRLILMGGGFMARSGDIEAEVNSDLTGQTKNKYWVQRGFVPDRYLAQLTDRKNVLFANTAMQAIWRGEQWCEDDWQTTPVHEPALETSQLNTDWSAPHYYAWLADQHGMEKYGENAGFNDKFEMADAFQMMADNGYLGIGWYTVGQLFEDGYAKLGDYANNIFQYGVPSEPEGVNEDFTVLSGVTPPGWRNFDNTAIIGDGGTGANLSLISLNNGPTGYGSVMTPVFENVTTTAHDSKVFNTLEIKIDSVSPGAYLDVQVQIEQGAYIAYPAFAGLNAPDTFRVNINDITGNDSLTKFSVKIWLNGDTVGDTVNLDYIRLIKEETPSEDKLPTAHITDALLTSFEMADLPSYNDNVIASDNLTGYSPDVTPVCQIRDSGSDDVVALEGGRYLYTSGSVINAGSPAYAYFQLFDSGVTGYAPIVISSDTRVSYWIYNKKDALDKGNSHVSIDMIFNDGTALRNKGIVDQSGILMHPAYRNVAFDEWIYVEADLSSLAGLSINEIRVGFDTGTNGEHFQAFIDRLRIFQGNPPGVQPLTTNWENGEIFGYRNSVLASGNVEGFLSYLQPECSPRQDGDAGVPAYRGKYYLMVAGNATAAPAYCYYWLANDVLQDYHNITIEPGMRMVYRIYQFANAEVTNHHVAVDFQYTDGNSSWELRNSGLVDQHGVNIHPAARIDPVNQWAYVEVDLTPLAGMEIDRVMIGFDEPTNAGKYRSYIEDLQFVQAGHEPMLPTADEIMTPTITPTATNTALPTETITPSPTLTPTMTPSPTASPTATETPVIETTIWQDHFVGTAGERVVSWFDESDNDTFNANISYSTTASWAEVIRTAEGTYGKVLSPNQTVDITAYPLVEIDVTGIVSGASWKLGIQEQVEPYRHWDLSGSQTGPGTFGYNMATVTGLEGFHTFSIEIIVESLDAGAGITVDQVRIYRIGGIPTVTVTPTATETNTPSPTDTPTTLPTATFTPTPTATPITAGNLWWEQFEGGTAGVQPAGWYDESEDQNFNAEIQYSATAGNADITLPESSGWGKVLSFTQAVNLNYYTRLEVKIQGMTTETAVRVGLFRNSTTQFWDCLEGQASINTPGVYVFDIPATTGEAGVQEYAVQLSVEGAQGKSAVFDWVRIYAPSLVTMTVTPTLTHTQTNTPEDTATFTATPTNTESPTPTITITNTPEDTATYTATPTNTESPTPTITTTNTPEDTATFTATPTNTESPTPTITITNTPEDTATYTATPTNTESPTPTITTTNTPEDTATFTATPTNTESPTPTITITNTPEDTATYTATPTNTESPTPTITITNTPEDTATYTATPTNTESPTPTITITNTPEDTATFTATPTNTESPTPTITITNTPEDTATFTATPTNTESTTPTITITNTPEDTATYTPTPTVTNIPTSTRTPSMTVTATPGITTPTVTPTPQSPQRVKAWPAISYFMHTGHTQDLKSISLYNWVQQPNINMHYEVKRGTGRFSGSTEAYATTGSAGEPALAAFTAGATNWSVNIIRVDNQGLGGRRYFPIIVVPDWWVHAASISVIDEKEFESMNFETDGEAEAVGNELLEQEIEAAIASGAFVVYTPTPVTPDPTATLSMTPTTEIQPTLTRTPIPTNTPFVEEKQVTAYPNPARGKVNFAYTIEGSGKVQIDIYKLTGERVASIVEHVNGGTGQTLSTAWDAVDVAPGIYFCRIVITDNSGKVVLDQKKKVALIQ